ncbi:TRAP transporter small permease [Brevibacterium album]|uniref:TRAP transporter small permease n=1 Tax=Brevibacterium album TaxID=417948 RepID=UPI0004117C50|nr:TRAP transporter small permease [Brevibacterium album]
MSEQTPGPAQPAEPEGTAGASTSAGAPAAEAEDYSFRQDRLEQNSALYRWIIRIERSVAGVFLVGVFVLVLTQVVSRYVFSSPFSWTEELARVVMVWLTFLAALFVSSRRAHITVDLLATVVPPRVSRAVSAFAELVVIATAAVMSIAGIAMVVLVSGVSLPATGLPTTLLYGAAVVGFAGIFIHSILALYLQIRHPEDELDPVMKAAELEGI